MLYFLYFIFIHIINIKILFSLSNTNYNLIFCKLSSQVNKNQKTNTIYVCKIYCDESTMQLNENIHYKIALK